jgi:Tol biopolymer transport system component
MSVASSPQDGRSHSGDQLDSWKEIAAYLKRGVRTVQQWEREAGLPVRRLATKKRGAVYAYKAEIDAWREQRSSLLAEVIKPSESTKHRKLKRNVAFAVLALAMSAVSTFLLWPRPLRVIRAQRLTFEGNVLTPAVSPDGTWIVYASPRENADGNLDLWLRSSRNGTQSRLTATSSHEFDPIFSPDSKRVLFTVAETRPSSSFELFGPGSPFKTSIYELDLSGHSRLILADANSARYSPDNRWIACLRSVQARTGTDALIEFGIVTPDTGEFSVIPLRLSSSDQLLDSSAGVWSPDGSYVLLNARTVRAPEFSWWLVSISARKAARIDLTSQLAALGAPGPLPAANFAPQAWLPDGTILAKGFSSGGIAIWATKLNVRANRLEGKPTKLAFPVTEPRWLSISGHTVMFSGGEQIAGLQVIPFDFQNARPLGPPRTIREVNTGGYGYLSLSRSGNMLAFESRQSSGGLPEVFALNLNTGQETPITGPRGPKMYSVMRPDGQRVAYGMIRFGSTRPIYLADTANGRSSLLCDDCGGRPSAWTPDGGALLLVRPMFRPQRIAVLPIAAPKTVDILESAKYALMSPSISPDGHWVAFTTKEGAAFVAPFRGVQPVPETEWIRVGLPSQQVLSIFWGGDESRIYSLSKDAQPGCGINSQRFETARGPTGSPEEIYRFDWPPGSEPSEMTRIVAAGNRILVPIGRVQSDLWTAELSKAR